MEIRKLNWLKGKGVITKEEAEQKMAQAEMAHKDSFDLLGERVSELVADDWGWMIPIENLEFHLWIGVGNYKEYPDGFLCFIEPTTEFVRRWFKKIPVVERVSLLRENMDVVLKSNNEVRDIKWWSNDESNNPAA